MKLLLDLSLLELNVAWVNLVLYTSIYWWLVTEASVVYI